MHGGYKARNTGVARSRLYDHLKSCRNRRGFSDYAVCSCLLPYYLRSIVEIRKDRSLLGCILISLYSFLYFLFPVSSQPHSRIFTQPNNEQCPHLTCSQKQGFSWMLNKCLNFDSPIHSPTRPNGVLRAKEIPTGSANT